MAIATAGGGSDENNHRQNAGRVRVAGNRLGGCDSSSVRAQLRACRGCATWGHDDHLRARLPADVDRARHQPERDNDDVVRVLMSRKWRRAMFIQEGGRLDHALSRRASSVGRCAGTPRNSDASVTVGQSSSSDRTGRLECPHHPASVSRASTHRASQSWWLAISSIPKSRAEVVENCQRPTVRKCCARTGFECC